MTAHIVVVLAGLIAGAVIAGGIFAFIVVIGVIPRLIQRTKTAKHIWLYETMITLGGIVAGMTLLGNQLLTGFMWMEVVIGLGYGIFIGCLSVSVAEVFNVLPILCRRAKLAKDIPWLLLVLGAGKTAAVLVYYFLPGFLMLE